MFKNKTILITGATGSFGNHILKKLIDSDLNEIRVFSRDEKKQEDMRLSLNNERVKFYIGDVRSYDSISNALKGVDFVFHAAALKQVPSCEFHPMEAVKTNILGAENVMNACINQKVSRLVMLSTDKAVYPINAMGISKAMMEKLTYAKARSLGDKETNICTTRYGNVMASRGSVIPLFVNQIKQGKDLTITDKSMTRFLMSLEDSIDLVLYAFKNSNQGDTLVQKASACTVGDLAAALINIFNSSSKISIIGTRHGEKLYESLLSREEMIRAREKEGYFIVPMDNRDLNYSKYFSDGQEDLNLIEDYTSHNTVRLSIKEVEEKLLTLNYIKEQLND